MDFDDVGLLTSDVIPAKITQYFTMFNNPKLNSEQQEEAFIEAADVVLSRAEINENAFNLVLDTLINTFEQSIYENLLTYLTESYSMKDSCVSDKTQSATSSTGALKEKIDKIKKLAISKPAPEVLMQGVDSKYQRLSDIKADCTLIVFWESTCPHCERLLPRLKDVYDRCKDKGFEVLAISLDKDRELLEKALDNGQYGWINYSELKGGDSKSAIDYNIWSTPKMYLLDKDKKIIGKPMTIEELEGLVLTVL